MATVYARNAKNDGRMYLQLTDYRALIKELNAIDKQLTSDLRKDFKVIGRGMQTEVKRALPKSYPLGPRKNPKLGGKRSGFDHNGRLGWGSQARMNLGAGKAYPADSVFVQSPARPKSASRGRTFSLLRLKVNSYATSLADMAGRGGRYTYGVKSRRYSINLFGKGIVQRTHMVNGQGYQLVQALNSGAKGKLKSDGSRYAWPAAEKSMPVVKTDITNRLQKSYDIINARLAGKS